jgi:hypothetical protein
MTTAFSIKESLVFGLEVFKKQPWFYISVVLALTLFSIIVDMLINGGRNDASLIGFLISFLASTIVSIAYARLALSVAEGGTPVGWEGLWVPDRFFPMLGTIALQGLIILVGLVLLIIPGIIAAVLLMFAQLAVVDKNLNPVEALKESYALAKPHLWQLVLFSFAILVLNVVGLLALVIGLLVTVPVSVIAVAHVYKKLVKLSIPAVLPTPTETPGA